MIKIHVCRECEVPIDKSVLSVTVLHHHYENTPMQYTAIFHGCKNVHFQMIFFFKYFSFFDQNIDCGYTLEPPQ